MSFKNHFVSQLDRHPSMQAQDAVKLCYQAAFGAEHLLSDASRARVYFNEEFNAAVERQGDLFELINDDVARVDLGVWKASGMPKEWLFNMFVASARVKDGGRERFLSLLDEVGQCISDEIATFSLEQWNYFIEEYKKNGMPPVRHSEIYRQTENPSYRIIDSAFLRILPILRAASAVDKDGIKVISIDGRAASGKTTLASLLSKVLDCDAVQMDDFFLPMHLRCEDRLSEAGGNVHYERFIDEVLPNIGKPGKFEYQAFDCGIMRLNGIRKVRDTEWRVVEGSYSHHPAFGDYASLRVFVTVNTDTQLTRILKRNGEKMTEIFRHRWIPMEERYFEAFDIKTHADICIKTD